MNASSLVQKVWNFRHTLRDHTFHGNEIVPNTRRLCLMNLFPHNIGELVGEPSVERSDALIGEPRQRVDYEGTT